MIRHTKAQAITLKVVLIMIHFYDFCHDIAQNNLVIISEYDMPNDEFKCIWQKERTVCQDANRINGQKATEKLFIPNL